MREQSPPTLAELMGLCRICGVPLNVHLAPMNDFCCTGCRKMVWPEDDDEA